jgi:hypothetical protein
MLCRYERSDYFFIIHNGIEPPSAVIHLKCASETAALNSTCFDTLHQ